MYADVGLKQTAMNVVLQVLPHLAFETNRLIRELPAGWGSRPCGGWGGWGVGGSGHSLLRGQLPHWRCRENRGQRREGTCPEPAASHLGV